MKKTHEKTSLVKDVFRKAGKWKKRMLMHSDLCLIMKNKYSILLSFLRIIMTIPGQFVKDVFRKSEKNAKKH